MANNIIYFNNAATTWPKPKAVIEAVDASLGIPFHEHGRATIKSLKNYPKLTRELLCDFFNAEKSENFQFTSNATDSLNLLIHGFVMKQKKKIHVITSELEHNSVLRPLRTLERDKKIDLSIIPFNKQGYIEIKSVKKHIQKNTKLAVLTHGSNILGTVQNIETIGKHLHDNGTFFIIDSAQTAGQINIDLSKLNVDAFVFTGHKSLFGYPGIGGFYIKEPDEIGSFKQGGTGVFSEYPYHPQEMPLKFESGTLNYPGIVSLYSGIKFIQKIGLKKIILKTRKMTNFILKELNQLKNINIYNKKPDLPIIAFNLHGLSNEDVGYILIKEFKIITRTGLHCAPLVHKKINNYNGCVRVSLSYLNSLNDCKKFVNIIKELNVY